MSDKHPVNCPCGHPWEKLRAVSGGPGFSIKQATECPNCGRRGPWAEDSRLAAMRWNEMVGAGPPERPKTIYQQFHAVRALAAIADNPDLLREVATLETMLFGGTLAATDEPTAGESRPLGLLAATPIQNTDGQTTVQPTQD